MKLSIIILNYRTRGLLRQCLRGIYHFPPTVEFEVIVVDNNSGDGSEIMVRDEFRDVRFVALPSNVGYPRGNNAGLKLARGANCLFLNTDVVVAAGQIDALCNYLDANPRIGAAGPRLVNADGTLQNSAFRFYRILTPLYHRTLLGQTNRGKKELIRFTYADWDHRSSRSVAWLMSSCLLVRRIALNDAGFFDERFFIYLADTDLCRRLWLNGWEVHYVATVDFIHYHRRQSVEDFRLTAIHALDWLKFLWKWRGHKLPAAGD